MKFEDRLLKLLNKGLKQGEEFNFKEFKITTNNDRDDGYYIVQNNNKFYLMDAINYAESVMMEDD